MRSMRRQNIVRIIPLPVRVQRLGLFTLVLFLICITEPQTVVASRTRGPLPVHEDNDASPATNNAHNTSDPVPSSPPKGQPNIWLELFVSKPISLLDRTTTWAVKRIEEQRQKKREKRAKGGHKVGSQDIESMEQSKRSLGRKRFLASWSSWRGMISRWNLKNKDKDKEQEERDTLDSEEEKDEGIRLPWPNRSKPVPKSIPEDPDSNDVGITRYILVSTVLALSLYNVHLYFSQ